MTDKISSEDFIKAFGGGHIPDYHEIREGQKFYGNGYKQGYADAKAEFERPQGKWIFRNGVTCIGYYKCSNCGEVERAEKNFCPNCGAKMQKGGGEE